MKFIGMMKIITGTNENRGIWISKITIFSTKWFEGGNYIFISCMCGFQTSNLSFCSSCKLLECYSLDNGLRFLFNYVFLLLVSGNAHIPYHNSA